MTTLPAANYMNDNARTQGEMKTALEDLRQFIEDLHGVDSANAPDRKNLYINGAMTVAQRNTSFTGVGASATEYTLDRSLVYTQGSPQARATVTQESGVFGGFGYSAKIDCTTAEAAVAATELWSWQTRIEAQDLQHLQYGNAAAKTLTLTFQIKSPKSGTHCVALYQPDGARSYVREFTVASANTAEEITVTFPGDASGTINNDNGEGLRVTWPLVAGSNFQVAADAWAAGEDYATSNQQNLLDNVANNFEITGVQLELGSIATPFERRSFGQELILCLPYLWVIVGASDPIAMAQALTATTGRAILSYPVRMRAVPSLTVSAAGDFDVTQADGTLEAVTGLTLGANSDDIATFNFTVAANLSAGDATRLLTDASGNGKITFDAEL